MAMTHQHMNVSCTIYRSSTLFQYIIPAHDVDARWTENLAATIQMYAQICIRVESLIPYNTGEEFNKSMGVAVDLSSETP